MQRILYFANTVYESVQKKPWLLFTCEEERHGLGAEKFCRVHESGNLPAELTARGTFSDISLVAPELGVAAGNLSSGYYNAHSLREYINCAELERTIERVLAIVDDAAQDTCPRYEFMS